MLAHIFPFASLENVFQTRDIENINSLSEINSEILFETPKQLNSKKFPVNGLAITSNIKRDPPTVITPFNTSKTKTVSPSFFPKTRMAFVEPRL